MTFSQLTLNLSGEFNLYYKNSMHKSGLLSTQQPYALFG